MKYDLTVWQFQKGWITNIKNKKVRKITNKITSIEKSDLLEIKWVWEETVRILIESWIGSKEVLMKTDKETIGALWISLFWKKWLLNFIETNKK